MKRVIILLIALLLIGASCSKGDDLIVVTADPVVKKEVTADSDMGDEHGEISEETVTATGETKSFNVTAKRYEFNPNTITVALGDRVHLNLKSTDVTHGFALPDFGIEERLPMGETIEAEFMATQKGTFEYSSHIFSGKSTRAMIGTVIVE